MAISQTVTLPTTDNRKWQDWRLKMPILTFLVDDRCLSCLGTFSSSSPDRKRKICRWNFDPAVVVPEIEVFPVLVTYYYFRYRS